MNRSRCFARTEKRTPAIKKSVPILLLVTALCLSAYTSPGASRPMSVRDAAHNSSAHASSLTADEGTNRGGLSRDGWYPEATLLTPANIKTGGFGLLDTVPVTGQVYAQPVMDGSNVIVATEENWVYGINQITGVRQWAVQVGANVEAQPFNDVHPSATSLASWDCTDLEPYVGITSTPVVDPTTGVIYVVAMEQLSDGTLGYFMHALNPATGQEEPNFPVEVEGAAQNNPGAVFVAYEELQRTALTLTGGTIYFGFSSHCDTPPYEGFVAGVSESGAQTALWSDVLSSTGSDGGIWQSGGGFSSDEPGQIIVASGNGNVGASPKGDIPGTTPPTSGTLGESDIRLVAQADGSLQATDFFTPYDAAALDGDDLDFGSGAPVLLPSEFGTARDPELLLQTGKEGYVYLLNAKDLGGVSPGNRGALAEHGPDGGAWATPGVWPGDGGYIYIPTSDGGTKSLGNGSQGDFDVFQVSRPSATSASFALKLVAKGPQAVGFGTSSPIVTSDATRANSAVVWVVQHEDGGGALAELQAYDAVPRTSKDSHLKSLTLLGEWPIPNAVKFASPGVGDNRLFVPTKSGQLLIFGLNAQDVVSATGADFGQATIGTSHTIKISLIARDPFTIDAHRGACGICTRTSQFQAVAISPSFVNGVLSVKAGQKLRVAITFAPTGAPGYRADVLRLVTSAHEVDVALSGTARASTPWVMPSTHGVTLPNYLIGGSKVPTSDIVYTNFGTRPAHVLAIGALAPPFDVRGEPPIGSTIGPGKSFTLRIVFKSHVPGTFYTTLNVTTDSPSEIAESVVNVSAVASAPPTLTIASADAVVTFGSAKSPVPIGGTSIKSVTVINQGGSELDLKSVTTTGPFALANPTENLAVSPGDSYSLNVAFLPNRHGSTTGSLVFDAAGVAKRRILLRGFSTGAGYDIPAPNRQSWNFEGTASLAGSTLVLTRNIQFEAGSAFWSTAITNRSFVANFTAQSLDGSGGNGAALVVDSTSGLGKATSPPLGGIGGEFGISDMTKLAVVVGEFAIPGTPSGHWIAISNGVDASTGNIRFIGTPVNLKVSTQDNPNDVIVVMGASTVNVYVDGVKVLERSVVLPKSFVVGFSGSTGEDTNLHEISGVDITVGGKSP